MGVGVVCVWENCLCVFVWETYLFVFLWEEYMFVCVCVEVAVCVWKK